MNTELKISSRLHHNAHVTRDMEAVRKFYEEDQEEFGPELPLSGFRHIAMKVDQETQAGIRDRLEAAGYKEPDMYILNHGYCYSLYVLDPAQLIIEFTVDHEDVDQINEEQRLKARSELERWLAGDHTPNNEAYHR